MLKKCLLGIALLGFSGLYGADDCENPTTINISLNFSSGPGFMRDPITVKDALALKHQLKDLSSLAMSLCGLEDKAFQIIIDHLSFGSSQWSLDLSSNNITDASIPAIKMFIEEQAKNQGLMNSTLNLQGNNFSFLGQLTILKTIQDLRERPYYSLTLLL